VKLLGLETSKFMRGIYALAQINNLEINQSATRRSVFDSSYFGGVYISNPTGSLTIQHSDFSNTRYNASLGLDSIDFGTLPHTISDVSFDHSTMALDISNSQNVHLGPNNTDFSLIDNRLGGTLSLTNISASSISGITLTGLNNGIIVNGATGLTLENLDIKNGAMNTAGNAISII
jgi:hypothetical protein